MVNKQTVERRMEMDVGRGMEAQDPDVEDEDEERLSADKEVKIMKM